MSPDPAGRRSPRPAARGVAVVRRAGTVYNSGGHRAGTTIRGVDVYAGAVARGVLAVAGMTTVMAGGGLLFGQVLANWLGV